MSLVVNSQPETERVDTSEEIKLGDWYWLSTTEDELDDEGNKVYDEVPLDESESDFESPFDDDDDDDDEEPKSKSKTKSVKRTKPVKLLVAITEIGTNYVEVTCVNDGSARRAKSTSSSYSCQATWRIHMNDFEKELTHEPNASAIIKRMIKGHEDTVLALMDSVRQLTAGLGIVPPTALAEGSEQTNALAAASGVADIKAHKAALVKAKEDQLPALFKKIELEHRELSIWMKAELLPMKAQFEISKQSIAQVEDRIFTVELYAGLVEELKQIAKGKPAPPETKIHLMQRRHYMDEECLARYEAGGMEFEDIGAFDKWLLKPENRNRILPHDRCVVAFKVRREKKNRGSAIDPWVKFNLEKADETTFLYIRNGQQVFRLTTEIEFEEDLFPDADANELLNQGDKIWIKASVDDHNPPISNRQYEAWIADFVAYQRDKRERIKIWNALSKEEREQRWTEDPRRNWLGSREKSDPRGVYHLCTPDSVYYDDAMRYIANLTKRHNRVATVLQGLIDRSPAFQPHPPSWKLWKADGFANAIELVYDNSRTLTSGDVISWAGYCERLRASLKVGSATIGQQHAWLSAERAKEERRRANDYRRRDNGRDVSDWWRPDGDPGPGKIATIARKRGGKFIFDWKRSGQRARRVPHPDKPGWTKKEYAGDYQIDASIAVEPGKLFNVSAYTPGDYRLFYDDPRTRRDYLKWAPVLLSAEDWHAGKVERKSKEWRDGGDLIAPESPSEDDDEED